ncbi:Diguanylate cyclase [Azospirillaceae bacterium]
MEEKRHNIRNVVEVAHSVLVSHYDMARDGVIDEKVAKELAVKAIRAARYREKEYFWINDSALTMVMHPAAPELNGRNMNDFKDPNGVYLFREFGRITQANGAGFVSYMWPKPGEEAPVSKISYVKAFEPWKWVIGSGVYLDDVHEEIKELRYISLGGTAIFAFLTLSLALWVGRGVTRRLNKVIAGLKAVASGKGDVDLTRRIAITSIDEIGILSSEFNSLMESIGALTRFKKIIEEDDSLSDVYSRLWDVFLEDLSLDCAHIYEVDVLANRMTIGYPLAGKALEQTCNQDILDNSALCKAKRTAHEISSLDSPKICKQFLLGDCKEHVCVPMSIGSGTLGVAQFIFDKPALADKALRIDVKERIFKASQFITEALPVIESKRLTATLRESSLTDPLTGLRNRRFLQECADNLCAGAKRRSKAVALLMCDLDFFKQINDSYGHDAGDDVLRQTARVLKESVRESDLLFRFGGEEFVVLLVDVDLESGLTVAEKIRRRLEAHKFTLSDARVIQKTISIGVSEYPTDSESFWRVLKFADVALYEAKEKGRNRAIRFTKEMWKDEQY